MKKLLISSAIAAAMGTSGFAHAVVDLSAAAADRDVPVYASELAVDPTDGLTLAANAVTTVTSELGFGVSEGQRRFIRVDLTGATFGTAPSIVVDQAGDDASADGTLTQGGADQDFAIFEITAPGAGTGGQTGFLEEDVVTISGHSLVLEGINAVSVEYQLFETAVDAVNGTNSLAASGGTLASFDEALVATAGESGNVELIDVTENSVLFEGGNQSEFGIANLRVFGTEADEDFRLDASAATIENLQTILVPESMSVEVSGDFSSAARLSNTGLGGLAAVDEDTFDADGNAVFGLGLLDAGTDASVDYTFVYETDGETVIPETTFALTVNLVATADFNLPETLGPITMDSFEKNGSTAETNLNLDPNGAFRNFVRITNPSGIDGRVFLTVINDDGDSVALNLDDVSVQGEALPGSLAAGASTRLIPMGSLISAAQAVDAEFGTVSTPRNKFRIIADGEFGDTNGRTGIRIDNVTLATDNTTFSTF